MTHKIVQRGRRTTGCWRRVAREEGNNGAFGRLRSRKYPALVLSGPTRSGPARPPGGPDDGRDRYFLRRTPRFACCWFFCPSKRQQVFDVSTVERVAPGVTRSKRLARFPPSRARRRTPAVAFAEPQPSGRSPADATTGPPVGVRAATQENGREPCSLPFLTYSAHGGLRQDPSEAGESRAVARNLGAR